MNREERRKYLFEFAREKSEYKNKLFKIICYADCEDIKRIIRKIMDTNSMRVRLESVLFPKDMAELGDCKFVLNKEMESEVIECFVKLVIKNYSNQINEYIILKNEFEKLLFSEKYIEALETLTTIEHKLGFSIWCISKKMLLYEKVCGLEKHKKYASELLEKTKKNILVSTLIEMDSYFAEENTSYLAYKKQVDDYIEYFKEDKFIRDYFDFKLNTERYVSKEEIKTALVFDSQLSIVDLYETYVISLQFMSITDNDIVEKEMLTNIKDFRIKNMLNFENILLLEIANDEYYDLLDLYTKGDYKQFAKECVEYLNNNPQNFQAITLLAKAKVMLGENDFTIKSYENIFNLYAMNEYAEQSIQELFSYIKVVKGTSWEYKIIGFLARKVTLNRKAEMSYISCLNDIVISPNFINNLIYKGNREKFISLFQRQCPTTAKLYLYQLSDVDLPIGIKDKFRENLFVVDKFISQQNYDSAMKILLDLSKIRNDEYGKERINRRLIEIYKSKKDYLKMIILATDSVLNNKLMGNRLNIKQLYLEVSSKVTNEMKQSIYYVMFIYVCFPNDYGKQRIAYSNFMDYNNYSSIDDVISKENNTLALICFLKDVCVQHLLKRDIILNPDGDKADEVRISILKSLSEFDQENKKKYFSEITTITKQKSIKDRIKQFNQSRIFVDTENIKRDNESTLKESFNRYIAMKEFDDDILSYDYTSPDYKNEIKKIIEEMNEKIKTSHAYSQKIIVLKGIISNITEEFLYNEKYGLNTFLSSRIRHGYCKNQLTTVFQEYNLLSKKKQNDSNEYLINEFWDSMLTENDKFSQKFKSNLSMFTYNIETKINEVKNSWLCIKYKENSDALLDYSKCVNSCLVLERDQIVDFETFYEEIINFLWGYTTECFGNLKEKIQKELLEFFQRELTNLYDKMNDMEEGKNNENIKLIAKNINLCKTKIGGKIKEFANVFEKRDVSYKDFSMNDLLDTCIEITTKLNNNFQEIDLIRNVNDTYLYKGEFFPYFVDAVNILINNALEHSGFNYCSDLKIEININKEENIKTIRYIQEELRKKKINYVDDEFYKISISNSLCSNTNIELTQERIASIFKKMKDADTIKRYSQSEGGTGLYKLYKTFQYNISTAYLILYSIIEDNFEITILFGTKNIIVKNGR